MNACTLHKKMQYRPSSEILMYRDGWVPVVSEHSLWKCTNGSACIFSQEFSFLSFLNN